MVMYEMGSTGQGVVNIQNWCNRFGFNNGKTLAVDGVYGPYTTAAVTEFQKYEGLLQDGRCGPYTLGAMARYGNSHVAGSSPTVTVPVNNGWSVVPHVVAYLQDNDVNCAPTSWSMGLASEFGVYISQDRLASLMHTGPNGTDPSDAIAEMQALRYTAYTKPWSQEGLQQLAKDVADPNVIVVLLVMTGPLKYDSSGNEVWKGDYGHYEYPTAVNVSQGLITMEDPMKGPKTWKVSAVEQAIAEHSGNSVFITAKK